MQRNTALDALRGIAIIGMILSGSIAFNNMLPGWMYHAQVGPPAYKFTPDVAGITWVDLVFPFFLFAMGVAIPIAMRKKAAVQKWPVTLWQLLSRGLLLAFFAIYLQHAKAALMKETPGTAEYLKSLLAFASMFLIYGIFPGQWRPSVRWALRLSGFIIAAVLLFTTAWYAKTTDAVSGAVTVIQKPFHAGRSDIIILVLANMALFGGLIWWLTRHNWWYRLAIIPFILAVFLAKDAPGSINQWLMNFTPVKWLYQFNFLKYLCIVLPGTVVGDLMLKRLEQPVIKTGPSAAGNWAAALLFMLIPLNLYGLYTRQLLFNLLATVGILICAGLLLRKSMPGHRLFRQLFIMGAYCLLLGLMLEAFQGGIKKDSATFSYYFTTTGLAIMVLWCFTYWTDYYCSARRVLHVAVLTGQNPMIAYVAGALFITPLFKITGAFSIFDWLKHNAFEALARGLLFTALVILVTALCTQLKLRWKT